MTDFTWAGVTADYNTATNWNPNTNAPPDAAGETAIFANTGLTSVNVSVAVAPDAWNFALASQNYVITGATVTLSAGVSNLANNGESISIANVLAGSGGVTQNGSSKLTLSGTNTYTGTTNLNAGTLGLGNSAALGATGAGNGTTAANNTTLVYANGVSIAEAITLASELVEALKTCDKAEVAV